MSGPAALSRRKRLLFSAALAVFVLVFSEALAQLAYYATAGDFLFRRAAPPIFEADPTRCYRVIPNLVYRHQTHEFSMDVFTDARGQRSDREQREVPFEKPPDVYRVLFLGPSFTFGWGSNFEDIYPNRIARELSVPGRRVEVVNLGTPTQGPGPQLCWLREEGWRYAPDLVVHTTYGAGVSGVVGACPEALECPVIEDRVLYLAPPTLLRRLIASLKNLGLVFYGYYAYHTLLASAAEAPEAGKELWSEGARAAPEDLGDLVAEFRRYVAFVQSLVGPDTPVAFIHIPLGYEVHPEDVPRWRHLRDPDPAAGRAQTAAAAAALQQAGVPLVDTTDALLAAGRSERMYYWLDIHLTPAGNRAVADAALPALQALVDSRRG